MVWSEYHRSSTSVNERIDHFFSPIKGRFRRIASNEFDKQVNVHVAMDNTIVLDEIRALIVQISAENPFFLSPGKLCQINSNVPATTNKKSTDTQNGWKPLVIIIPLRLGLSEVNMEYIDQLKVSFREMEGNPIRYDFSYAFDCLKPSDASAESPTMHITSSVI